MTRDDLIDQLVDDLRPVPHGAVSLRLALGIGCGAIVSAVIMMAWIGLRSDIAIALGTAVFWIKLAYTSLLVWAGYLVVECLSRPTGTARRGLRLALAAVATLLPLSVFQLVMAEPTTRGTLFLGSSAAFCFGSVLLLAVPLFLGIVWSLRALAPTRLTLAGAASGLLAGSVAAWLYAFHCPEPGIAFMASWYTAGILASGLLGALLGRRLLRW